MNYLHFRFSTLLFSIVSALLLMNMPQKLSGQNGLLAEFYDGTNFNRFVSRAYVGNIENEWYDTPPVSGIDPHECSIRWTGKLKPAKTATYLFSAQVDDGIRVWIDGELIINQWDLNDLGLFAGKKALVGNHEYSIKVEYFNALNEGEIKLMWAIEKPSAEQSWYEYFAGVEYQYQVISSNFFVRPPEPKLIKAEIKEPAPQKTKKVETKSAPVAINTQKQTAPTAQVIQKEPMTKVKAEKYIPKNVQFVISQSEFLETSYEELNTFAVFMLDNPKVSVTIEGHTDVVGDKEKNQELSERRAKKVAGYLIQKGISGQRIKTIGYGGSKPLKISDEEKYNPLNRRVVFVLSGIE